VRPSEQPSNGYVRRAGVSGKLRGTPPWRLRSAAAGRSRSCQKLRVGAALQLAPFFFQLDYPPLLAAKSRLEANLIRSAMKCPMTAAVRTPMGIEPASNMKELNLPPRSPTSATCPQKTRRTLEEP
jgi:hypothetical protein